MKSGTRASGGKWRVPDDFPLGEWIDRTQPERYSPEHFASPLLDILDSPGAKECAPRPLQNKWRSAVEGLGRFVLQIQDVIRMISRIENGEEERELFDKLHWTLHQIANFLKRREHRIRVGLSIRTKDARFWYQAVPTCELGELFAIAIEYAARLSETGDITRVRQCAVCKGWYFARLKRQRFCSSRCRVRNYFHSNEGRKKWAEYMRNYRRTVKKLRGGSKLARRKSRR